MLFNSYIYFLLFLPLVLAGHTLLNKVKFFGSARFFLVVASLAFYGWWEPRYLILIGSSVIFNYLVGVYLYTTRSKPVLIFGVVVNIGLLGYYKYADFFVRTVDSIFQNDYTPMNIILPLAISFFTFQQIAYLVDSWKGATKEHNFINYLLFVTFFPQLIAGPIVHHGEMMPQFASTENRTFIPKEVARGLFIFSIGLAKKVIIADTFALFANHGYDNAIALSFFNAWSVSLAYTFQLYFDFSGYTDMAIGSAKMFNITLPFNFNSPYKATNIQDFWKRWHMTLSRWLKDYLYIPLGGNKKGENRTYKNLFATFLLGGLWHGAAWTFIAWGLVHGVASVVHRSWQKSGRKLTPTVGGLLTFLFVHFAWVLFRAPTFGKAFYMYKGLLGLNGVTLPLSWKYSLSFLQMIGVSFRTNFEFFGTLTETLPLFIVTAWIIWRNKNSNSMGEKYEMTWGNLLATAILLAVGIFGMGSVSEFLYFTF